MPMFTLGMDENGKYTLDEVETNLAPGSLQSFLLAFFCKAKDTRPVEMKRKVNYREYIQSDEWRLRSTYAKIQADFQCQRCGRTFNRLDTHHKHYQTLGQERMTDLEVLCRDCHRIVSGK